MYVGERRACGVNTGGEIEAEARGMGQVEADTRSPFASNGRQSMQIVQPLVGHAVPVLSAVLDRERERWIETFAELDDGVEPMLHCRCASVPVEGCMQDEDGAAFDGCGRADRDHIGGGLLFQRLAAERQRRVGRRNCDSSSSGALCDRASSVGL